MAIAEMTLETLENKENISSNDGLAAVTKEKTAGDKRTYKSPNAEESFKVIYFSKYNSALSLVFKVLSYNNFNTLHYIKNKC